MASTDDRTTQQTTALATVALAASTPLPDVSGSLTSANQAALTQTLNSLTPVGTTPNVSYSANGSGFSPSVTGALNVAVVTAPSVGSNVPLPGGYRAGFITGGNATLVSSANNGGVLVGTSAIDTLVINSTSTVADTLIGGNGANYFYLNSEVVFSNIVLGGSGQNFISDLFGGSVITSIGTDTIIGAAGSTSYMTPTVTSYGNTLFFNRGYFNALSGAPTLSGFSGTVIDSTASPLVFSSDSLDFHAGSGSSTIVAFGQATISGGTGPTLAFANRGMQFQGSSSVDTIVGLNGSYISATTGINGALIFGGISGTTSYRDAIVAGAGATTYIGAGYSAVTLAGGASHLIGLANGNVDARTSAGANTIFDNGSATISGGTGTTAIVAAGSGNSTLTPGSGDTLLVVDALVRTSRTLTITNFDGSHDFVNLQGYSPGADAAAYASATVSGVNTTVTLTDGTHIVFQSPANLASFSFS